jgi:hypothetical protein
MKTPVAFFVFNRPDLTRRVIERIAAARPERLLVVADAPRPGHGSDEALCEEVRRIVSTVDWPCEVETNFSDRNLGCGRRISSGLDWVFERHDRAIVLEDDCLPSTSFFPYCDELLERYRDDDRVGMISGCNLGFPFASRRADYCFSRYPYGWGWASWRRAWKDYDFALNAYDPGVFDELFDDPMVAAHVRGRVERSRSGELDTWDYQWLYTLLAQSRLSIVPTVNLIANIGFGREDATHTNYVHPFANLQVEELRFPLRHPAGMVPSRAASGFMENLARQLQAMQGASA